MFRRYPRRATKSDSMHLAKPPARACSALLALLVQPSLKSTSFLDCEEQYFRSTLRGVRGADVQAFVGARLEVEAGTAPDRARDLRDELVTVGVLLLNHAHDSRVAARQNALARGIEPQVVDPEDDAQGDDHSPGVAVDHPELPRL